jgi:hypothetical protein
MHAQGAAFPHAHTQASHLAALSGHGGSPYGLPGAGGLPPGLLALQGVAAAAQQAFLKDEKGLCIVDVHVFCCCCCCCLFNRAIIIHN